MSELIGKIPQDGDTCTVVESQGPYDTILHLGYRGSTRSEVGGWVVESMVDFVDREPSLTSEPDEKLQNSPVGIIT